MSNHHHLVPGRADTAANWSGRGGPSVGRRCSSGRRWYDAGYQGESLIEPELAVVQQLIGRWGGFHQLVCVVAQRKPGSAGQSGKMVARAILGRALQEQALLTESALLGLHGLMLTWNPIRAAIADRPGAEQITPASQRLDGEQSAAPLPPLLLLFAHEARPDSLPIPLRIT